MVKVFLLVKRSCKKKRMLNSRLSHKTRKPAFGLLVFLQRNLLRYRNEVRAS